MGMPDEEHPQRRSTSSRTQQQEQANQANQPQTGQEVEVREGEAREGEVQAAEPYVDPYKQVYNPLELPANTVAAQAYVDAHPDAVDPEVPISEERAAQATEAIQAHQDRVQEVMAGVGDDPRLGGGTLTTTSERMTGEHQERRAEKEEQKR
jgi:hypothetical protein